MAFKDDYLKINSQTDNYFLKTKKIITKFGDKDVTYAVFLRRPGILAIKMAIDWIKFVAKKRKIKITINSPYKEGDWFGAGEPILYIRGSMKNLVDLVRKFERSRGDGKKKFLQSEKIIDQVNLDDIPQNTILVHRKKESNTLYTINALNELIKKLNDGIVDTKFPISWQHYRNTILLTQHDELKQLRTKIHKIIEL